MVLLWEKLGDNKNMIKHFKTKLVLFSSYIYLISAGVSFAQPGGGGGGLTNPIKAKSIDALIAIILDFVVTIGTPIVVIMIIFSGFKFVAARGKPDEITTAKRSLIWVLVGAAIILGAQVLKTVITGTVADIRSGTGQ